MADYLTFNNIQTEVGRAVRDPALQKGDYIKMVINMVYLDEVLTCDDLFPIYWLREFDDSLASVGPATITGITQADPGVITTSSAHGLVAGDLVNIYSIVGMTELNNRVFRVNTAPSTTTLTLIDLDNSDAIDTSAYTAWSSGGSIVHRGKTLSTSVQRILNCKWHGESYLKPIGIEALEKETKWWDSSTTRPEMYMHRKSYSEAGVETNQLLWFQGADQAYDFRYWYERRPTRLEENADVPKLPPQYHWAIVAGAVARIAESNVEVESPSLWPTLYLKQLEQIKLFNRSLYGERQYEKPYLL